MLVTESETMDKLCPQPSINRCHGSGCMAWRWAKPPILSKTLCINSRALERSYGITMGPTYANMPDEEFNRIGTEYIEACRTAAVTFNIPDGWRAAGAPSFDPNDEDGPCWSLDIVRDVDPVASGYCGLAGGVE